MDVKKIQLHAGAVAGLTFLDIVNRIDMLADLDPHERDTVMIIAAQNLLGMAIVNFAHGSRENAMTGITVMADQIRADLTRHFDHLKPEGETIQ